MISRAEFANSRSGRNEAKRRRNAKTCKWIITVSYFLSVYAPNPPSFRFFGRAAGHRGEGTISNRALNGRLVVIL